MREQFSVLVISLLFSSSYGQVGQMGPPPGQSGQPWTLAEFDAIDTHLKNIQMYARSLQDIVYQERMKQYPFMPNSTAGQPNMGYSTFANDVINRLTKIEFETGELVTQYPLCPSGGTGGNPYPVIPPNAPPPQNVMIQSETIGNSSSVIVSWDRPNVVGTDVRLDDLQYKVYFAPLDEYGQQTAEAIVFSICSVNQTVASITDLYPRSFYKVSVGTVICSTSESSSGAKSLKTPDIIPSEPTNLRVDGTKPNAIALRWDLPLLMGTLANYTIYVTSENGTGFEVAVDPTQVNAILYDLIEGTRYVISVSAFSDNGESPKSSSIEVMTDVFVPDMPRFFQVIFVNTTSVHLVWEPPNPGAGMIRYYSINYTDSLYSQFFNFKTPNAKITTAIITGLQPATTYYFRAFAHTGRRAGAGSAVIMQDTDITVPTVPRELYAQKAKNDPPRARLQWLPPAKTYGSLKNYSIHWGVKNGATRKEEIEPGLLEWYSDFLDDNTEHEFKLYAQNEKGYGPAATVTHRTPKRDTVVPPNVKVDRKKGKNNETVLVVSWNPITQPGKQVSGFRILYRKFEWVYTGRWSLKEIPDPNARSATIGVENSNYSFIVVVRGYRNPRPNMQVNPPWPGR
uniref:Fibronectin type III domain-containing protein 2 n=1 Tax=Margaritifera margaritifera TaxID=102329 RepID=FND2_PINMG|nr:RecName: Full=Fibronectin type III domain-containing protein 2; Flags: Precursor [Pinctada margaritifera]CCE46159.1 fibronectin 3 [Pinctada margaritifera]